MQVFEYKLYKFYYDEALNKFLPIEYNIHNFSNAEIQQKFRNGIRYEQDYLDLYEQFGENSTEVPVKPTHRTVIEEILTPFYIFQIFSIVVWLYIQYYYYACFICMASLLSVVVTLKDTQKNQRKL